MESTKERLLFLMERYEIGKKPLSRLLGWGETTVMRYLDGVEPNREFAARIEELCEDPWQYAKLLEREGSVLTDTAYKKTKRAVYSQMFHDKSTEAMQYVIGLAKGDIAPFWVVMILYYAQVTSLVGRGIPIFEEEVSVGARQKTPYPRLHDRLLKYGVKTLLPEEGALSAEDKEFLESIYRILNGYSLNAVMAVWKKDKRQLQKQKAALQSAGKQEEQKTEELDAEALRSCYEKKFPKNGIKSTDNIKEYLAARLKEK